MIVVVLTGTHVHLFALAPGCSCFGVQSRHTFYLPISHRFYLYFGVLSAFSINNPFRVWVSRSHRRHKLAHFCRLQLQLPLRRTDSELFELQRGVCPGCREQLPPLQTKKAPSLSSYFWGTSKLPRRCCYTNLLYCQKCHNNGVAILPSRVLHKWDFSLKPVCALANDYLASIYARPVLCVGAVNPGLFARVPTLARAQSLRQKIVRTLEVIKGSGSPGSEAVEVFMQKSGGKPLKGG